MSESKSFDLDRLLQVTPDLILVTDAYGQLLKVSHSSQDILGYDHHLMEGHLALDFLYPPDLQSTREEMRRARLTGRPRYFACRYVAVDGSVVALVWKGIWLPDEKSYMFIGRSPFSGELTGWVTRLDALDGFQIAKGLYAASLAGAGFAGIGSHATAEARNLFDVSGAGTETWLACMCAYAVACLLCLFWKQRWFQFAVSLISVILWIWMGFVTLWAPDYVAAAGLYEVILGFASIWVLYFRGRQL